MQRPSDQTAADRALARFVATGSPRAMAELFDATAGELLLLARRLVRDPHDAEDLVQQTYLQVIRGASTWRSETGPVGAWMTAILVNEARSSRRAEARRRRREAVRSVGVDACDLEPGPDRVAERRELQQDVQRLLDELPAAHRDAVAMRVCHGIPPRLIARALGLPVETVKTRLKRGLRQLEERLPRHLALGGVLVAGDGLRAVRRSVVDAARVSAGSTGLAAAGSLAAAAIGVVGMAKLLYGAVLAVIVGVLWLTWDEGPKVAGADLSPEGHNAVEARSEGSTAGAVIGGSAPRSVVAEVEGPEDRSVEATGSVSVRAIWSPSGDPAADVPVTLLGRFNRHLGATRTDTSGECRFDLAGGETASVQCGLLPGRYFPAASGSGEPIVLEIDEGLRIRGRVVDAERRPVAGAAVFTRHGYLAPSWSRTYSGRDGSFELRGLGEVFAVRAWLGDASSPELERADVVAAAESGCLELALTEPAQEVDLDVVTPAGVAVAGALVQLLAESRTDGTSYWSRFTTDARGRVRLGGVLLGSYRLEVAHRAHPPGLLPLEVVAGQKASHRVVLGPAVAVRGRVSRPDGEPVVGVRIDIFDAVSLFRGGVHSDVEGGFRFENLSPGRWELWVESGGERQRELVVLSDEDAVQGRDIQIVMRSSASIRGVLVDAHGAAVPGWRVRARRHDHFDGGLFARTDSQGRFEIASVNPGRSYRMEVQHPEGGGHHTFFGVAAGAAELTYRLPPQSIYDPASLSGRLVEAPNGSSLWRWWGGEGFDGGGTGTQLAEDGSFRFEGLRPGPWVLGVGVGGTDTPVALCSIDVAPGAALDLGDLQVPSMRGSVLVRVGTASAAERESLTVVARPETMQSHSVPGVVVGDRLWRIDGLVAGREYAIGCASWEVVVPAVRVVAPNGEPVTVDLPIPDTRTVLEITRDDDSIGLGVVELRIYGARSGDLLSERTWVGSLRHAAVMAVGDYRYEVRTGAGFRGNGWFRVAESPDGGASTVRMPVIPAWK